MLRHSIIPPALLTAYHNTTYIINDAGDSVRIGKPSPAADRICRQQNAESWLFITPYNPRSEILPRIENEKRMEALKLILQKQDLMFLEGEGRGEDAWEPERSLFVPGVSRAAAIDLGKHFEQFAVVFGEVGKIAELLEIPLVPKR